MAISSSKEVLNIYSKVFCFLYFRILFLKPISSWFPLGQLSQLTIFSTIRQDPWLFSPKFAPLQSTVKKVLLQIDQLRPQTLRQKLNSRSQNLNISLFLIQSWFFRLISFIFLRAKTFDYRRRVKSRRNRITSTTMVIMDYVVLFLNIH